VFHAQDINTFEGEYQINQPSLGSFFQVFLSFIFVVQDFVANVNPFTCITPFQVGGLFVGFDSIYHIKETTFFGTICLSFSISFL
jgi:hypothetical protein